MLRLEKSRDSHLLRVSGRIDAENLAELKMEMQIHPSLIALELGEVTLVDAEAVRFLAVAQAAGTELRNCPLFIREWIRSGHPELMKGEGNESARIHVSGRNDGFKVNF
jgi:Zn finger protein HypA/HybF involved in hydrogenase expression